MSTAISDAREQLTAAQREVKQASSVWDKLPMNATDAQVDEARVALDQSVDKAEAAEKRVRLLEEAANLDVRVNEPDMYTQERGSFLGDLYKSQLRSDPVAAERISRHQIHELGKMPEKRAIATGTLGGIVPPAYLVSMYAKASRNGRVFADQVNHQDLPEEGMSLIVPRITTPSAAGIQASESATLTTQDVAETDLTVPVRTIGGYLPVSRQTLERASYSEPILFEDLLARTWSALDNQLFTGDGNSGTALGVFHTAGLTSLSANSDGSIAKLWSTVANAKQQVLTKWGGLGLVPAKIIMHPRRWAVISAALDGDGRPLFGYNNMPAVMTGVLGAGSDSAYGFVGYFHGLPTFTDANMPVNLDTNSNRDAIVILPSNGVHLWEPPDGLTTLSFEQQNGNALQVQLVAYQYFAFTCGRYPDATAVIDDFPAPTFT